MASKTWKITNAVDPGLGGSFDDVLYVATAPKLEAQRYRLRGGLSDGVDVLSVRNGEFTFRLLPTRGMGIWDASHRGERIGWQSPVRGPVHPAFVPLTEPSGLGWLDGFDELLCRCGLESNGAPDFDDQGRLTHPLHGRIANKPAHRVEVTIDDQAQELTVVGVVEETRFHFSKLRLVSTIRTRTNEPGFRIHDEIENLSDSPAEAQLLYHVNFGAPLLDAGASVVAPIKTLAPRNERAAAGIDNWNSYAAPQAGFEEQVYFLELLANADGNSAVLLKNAHGTRGVRLAFATAQLPCFTVWKNTTAVADGYVTGLEPGTNYPNPRSFEGRQQRVVKIPARGKAVFDLAVEYLAGDREVQKVEREIRRIQEQAQPRVLTTPQPTWSAS